MIPKIIHYCWFGRNPETKLMKKCICSWLKHLPDYELRLWNEDSFDINSNRFTKEAYEKKKWAFVADYARLYALYHYGGIYFDTDVEVIKNMDVFLNYSFFAGMEDNSNISAGVMGAVPGHPWIGELLEQYNRRDFILSDGKIDYTTIVSIITENAHKIGFQEKNYYQILHGNIHIFPTEYFYPISPHGIKNNFTNNTYTIHHFEGSWLPRSQKLKNVLRDFIGPENYLKLHAWLKKIMGRR